MKTYRWTWGQRSERWLGRLEQRLGLRGLALTSALMLAANPALGQGERSAHTVGTIAGPGFCPTAGRPSPNSADAHALAVDSTGAVYFDTGPPEAGVVAIVETGGRVRPMRTGLARQTEAPSPEMSLLPGSSRLAPAPGGAVFVAGAGKVVRADSTSIVTVAGADDLEGEGPSSAAPESGPMAEARFAGIRSVASDDVGNLYVVDRQSLHSEDDPASRLRFLNRSTEPVTYFPGSPAERSVLPGAFATIATIGARPSTAGGTEAVHLSARGTPTAVEVAGDLLYLATYEAGTGGQVSVLNLGSAPISAHGIVVEPASFKELDQDTDQAAGGARAGAMGYVPGMAADQQGRLYLADHDENRVVRIEPDGTAAIVAGTGLPGFDGNDLLATDSRIDHPYDVALGPGGRVYISDQGNGAVRVIDESGVLRTVPGSGLGSTVSCGGAENENAHGRAAGPVDVAANGRETVFVALADGHLVKAVSSDGSITTVAGSPGREPECAGGLGCQGFRGDGQAANIAWLDRPSALAVDPWGNLYVLDAGNGRVRFVNLGKTPVLAHGVEVAPGAIETIAGGGDLVALSGSAREVRIGGTVTGFGDFTFARLGSLATQGFPPIVSAAREGRISGGGLVTDGVGNLYISDPLNGRVLRVDRAGGLLQVSAELREGQPGCCERPWGLALDGRGNLFVADGESAQVWALNVTDQTTVVFGHPLEQGGAVAVAGGGSAVGGGAALDVRFQLPTGVAWSREGTLFVSDLAAPPEGGAIYEVDQAGETMQVLGNGTSGFNGDRLNPKLTSLNLPTSLEVDPCGALLIADAGNDRVRRLGGPGSCALAPDDVVGETANWLVAAVSVAGIAIAGLLAWLVLKRLGRRHRCLVP